MTHDRAFIVYNMYMIFAQKNPIHL